MKIIRRHTTYFDLLMLLAVCLLAYWPLTFHVLSLKNDALNYFLPVRFQISEAISSHQYPFWSPYFNLGYALHGDMQSGVWNPIVQLLSLFGPYTLYTLQLETLLYIFLSGAGMYSLLKYFSFDRRICFTVAVAFMLCGFNSDSCQFLNWISAAAFLPFVVLWYFRMLTAPDARSSVRNALLAGLFLYLLFVTAYPAHFVVTLYLLLAMFICHTGRQIRAQTRAKTPTQARTQTRQADNSAKPRAAALPRAHLLRSLLRHLPMLLTFLILSLPAILSYARYLPLSERGNGAGYADAMSDSLHPLMLVSYVAPLAVFKMPWTDVTDMLQRNSWFGLLVFIFTISSFFIRTRDPHIRFAKWAFVVFQLMSLGQFGGIRSLAYYLLPLMDSFRHPACIKLFTIGAGCFLAAWSLQHLAKGATPGPNPDPKPGPNFTPNPGPNPDPNPRPNSEPNPRVNPEPNPRVNPDPNPRIYKLTSLACATLLGGLLIFSLPGLPGLVRELSHLATDIRSHAGTVAQSAKKFSDTLTLPHILIIEVLLEAPFLFLLLRFALPKRDLTAIGWLTTINCVLHIFLFTPFTVARKDSAAHIQHILDQTIVRGYPVPALDRSLAQNSLDDSARFQDIGCSNMYNKLVGRNGYRISPSNLLTQNEFWFDQRLRNTVMSYPLLYKPDRIISTPPISPGPGTIAVVDDSRKAEAIRAYQTATPANLSFQAFQPEYFCVTCDCPDKGFYVLLQNDYPLWRLKVDGREQPIIRANVTFMGAEIPAGRHKIEFVYADRPLIAAFWISTAAFLALLLWRAGPLSRARAATSSNTSSHTR